MIFFDLEYIIKSFYILAIAFVLDMYLADRPPPKCIQRLLPHALWKHPVCHVGALYTKLEPWGRAWGERVGSLRLAGGICLCINVGLTGAVVWTLTHVSVWAVWLGLPTLTEHLSWGIRLFIDGVLYCIEMFFIIYFAYSGLATGCLLQTYKEVLEKVEHAPLEEAQEALSHLVSRDTKVLDRQMLRKSLADTMTENITDAVIAPMFWLFVAGPVGLWMYKAVSTADSMWGYKTPRFLHFGFAGAKADDILAFIPARLAALVLKWVYVGLSKQAKHIGGYLLKGCFGQDDVPKGGTWPGMDVIAEQAKGMESPNSGWPMAAAAWIAGASLGGPTQYFGSMVEKPWVGPSAANAHAWDEKRLKFLEVLVRTVAICFITFLMCFSILCLVLG